MSERNAAIREAMKAYAETHTVCDAPACRWGYVVTDVADIDPMTLEPRRVPCPACAGVGFVPKQRSLPL